MTVLPNFLLIGAFKSGTTSLYGYLSQHPDIFMPRVKEPSFFALEGQEDRKTDRKIVHLDDYLRLFEGYRGEKAIGEASPMYLHSATAVHRIRHYIPEARFLAILRNPVDAFYSNHYMHVREARVDYDFDHRLNEYVGRIRSGQVAGPFYYAHLKRYYDTFSRDRIRVYLFEDLKKDTGRVVRDIFGFLGVDPDFTPAVEKRRNVGGLPKSRFVHDLVNGKNPASSMIPGVIKSRLNSLNMMRIPPMPEKQRLELLDCFREDIENLQGLIGRDLGPWLQSGS